MGRGELRAGDRRPVRHLRAARPDVGVSAGPPRLLSAVYLLFAIAAGARSAYQLGTHFDEAPVAYLLSGLAAAVYMRGHGRRAHRPTRAAGRRRLHSSSPGVLAVGGAHASPTATPSPTRRCGRTSGRATASCRSCSRSPRSPGWRAGQASATRSSSASASRSSSRSLGVELALERLRSASPRAARGSRAASRSPAGVSSTSARRPSSRVRAARDEAGGLEVADRLRHRLRAHALGGGEVADARGPLAVEAAEHGELRDGRAGLGAQAADEPAERSRAARARAAASWLRAAAWRAVYRRSTGKLYRLPVY